MLGHLEAGTEFTAWTITLGLAGKEQWLVLPAVGFVPYERSKISLVRGGSEAGPPREALVVAPLHPASVRTGIAAVDGLIEAVTQQDQAWIEARLVLFSGNVCLYESCRDIVDAVPIEYLQGRYLTPPQMTEWLAELLAGGEDANIEVDRVMLLLYAVLDLAETPFEHEREERYYVVFGYNSGGGVAFYLDADGGIRRARVELPGETPATKLYLMTSTSATFILPPRVPPPLVP